MGRPLNKRYFGSIKDDVVQSAQNPTQDGKDQAGHTLTDTNVYSEKKLGYNIPVYTARVANAGTTYAEVTGPGEYPYIVKQTGSRSYRVRISATAAEVGKAKLVNKAAGTLSAGEMVIQGFIGGDSGNAPTNIAELTKFYATDFNGNRYKWHVIPGIGVDSSLANILVLTAATTASVN
jgi:hypothetical protein